LATPNPKHIKHLKHTSNRQPKIATSPLFAAAGNVFPGKLKTQSQKSPHITNSDLFHCLILPKFVEKNTIQGHPRHLESRNASATPGAVLVAMLSKGPARIWT